MLNILSAKESKTPLNLTLHSKFFRALGDPTRLRILNYLSEGEKNVGELVKLIGAGQGRVSDHLCCLKSCGLASTRRDGKFIYYKIADEQVRDLLKIARDIISHNAEQIWACTRVSALPGDDEAQFQKEISNKRR